MRLQGLEDNGNIAFHIRLQFFLMTGEIVILCTCSSEIEAQRISIHLLEEHLAACVNVVPLNGSYYWWQGAIESSKEQLLLIKSSAALFSAVEEAVRKIHSYQVPELLALPVLDGSSDYLEWLRSNLRQGAE
jgi:periplasmic divalent cation tolerance protein